MKPINIFKMQLAVLSILVALSSSLFAATFVVTKTTDTNDGACNSDCSLREAMIAANATPTGDAIIVPAGTYALTIAGAGENLSATGDLDTTVNGGNLTILGSGAGSTIIESAVSDRVFNTLATTSTITINKVTLRNGSISGSSGGNVLVSAGTLFLSDCSIESGSASAGGAILVQSSATLIANRCSFLNNTAFNGGAIASNPGSALTFSNCTFDNNHASADGGAIYSFDNMNLANATITNNTAGAIGGALRNAGGAFNIRNSIVAGNTAPSGPDCDAINSLGFNLIGNSSGCVIAGSTTGNLLDTDPLFAPLAQNGGPTVTHALRNGSPAIDSADNANCPAVDQRSLARPQGGGCDMGAVEQVCLVWKEQFPLAAASQVASILFDPSSPSTIYASLGTPSDPVLKSTNSGTSWNPTSSGLPFASVLEFVIDPTAPQILYAGTISNGVFKTTNGGATWNPSNTGYIGTVRSMAMDPRNSAVLYIGVDAADGNLFKSTDSGASWNAANTGFTSQNVRAVAVDPFNSAVIYTATSGGMLRSTNSGANWQAFNNGLTLLNGTAIAADPRTQNRIFFGSVDQASISLDAGLNWSPIAGLSGVNIRNFAIDPSNASIAYASTFADGIFKSTDGGVNWKPLDVGLPVAHIRAIAVSSIASIPFAAAETVGIFGLTQPAFFCDDFEDGDASDWTPVKGVFGVVSGTLQGTFPKKGIAIAPSPGCVNCTFDGVLSIGTPGSHASLLGWYIDKNNGVELAAMDDKDKWLLTEKIGGTKVVKAKLRATITDSTPYHVALSFDGSNFHVVVDGVEIMTVPTTVAPPSGAAGVQVKSKNNVPATVTYDDVIVF